MSTKTIAVNSYMIDRFSGGLGQIDTSARRKSEENEEGKEHDQKNSRDS
jgi:hypothetical protein